MPGLDRTGPLGEGPLTGRGFGPCGRGLGFRHGYGRGYGFRARAMPVITEKEEADILKDELKLLKQEMQDIEKRLKELKA